MLGAENRRFNRAEGDSKIDYGQKHGDRDRENTKRSHLTRSVRATKLANQTHLTATVD